MSRASDEHLCAVIVTFNRKYALANCIRSICSAEVVPGDILVVDNASTDGTADLVTEHFPKSVSVLRLPRNCGGAGGFKAGMAAARERHSLIWVMDDDHELEPHSLQALYEAMLRSNSDIVGPVMMNPDRSGALSWAMGPIGPRGQQYLDYATMVRDYGPEGLVPQIPAPFNAVLYRREVLDVLGLPDERLFIRGDEIEYAYRIERQRVKSVVVVAARVYHPPSEQKYTVLTLGQRKLTALYTSNELKDYCTFRNRAFYFKKYGVYKSLLLDCVRYPLFFLFIRRLDVNGCWLWFKGYVHGLAGHFGYERHFLP